MLTLVVLYLQKYKYFNINPLNNVLQKYFFITFFSGTYF